MPTKLEIKQKQQEKKRDELEEYLCRKGWKIEHRFYRRVDLVSPDEKRKIILDTGVLYVVDYVRKNSGATILKMLILDIAILTDSLKADYIELHV